MGAGASSEIPMEYIQIGLTAGISAAPMDELRSSISTLPEEPKTSLKATLLELTTPRVPETHVEEAAPLAIEHLSKAQENSLPPSIYETNVDEFIDASTGPIKEGTVTLADEEDASTESSMGEKISTFVVSDMPAEHEQTEEAVGKAFGLIMHEAAGFGTIFNACDTKKAGSIEADDLTRSINALGMLSDMNIDDLLRACAMDGKLRYYEFVNFALKAYRGIQAK